MDVLYFNNLLLKTAFSCMACDGDIDQREIDLIKQLHKEKNEFGELNVDEEMDKLLSEINEDGHKFMRGFFNELTSAELTEIEELQLIEVAIDTIKADEKVEYAEIKFFKVIRSMLKIDDDPILEKHPDFEDYLEQDIITDSYLSRLQDDFFETHVSKEFSLLNEIDKDALNDLMKDNTE